MFREQLALLLSQTARTLQNVRISNSDAPAATRQPATQNLYYSQRYQSFASERHLTWVNVARAVEKALTFPRTPLVVL